MKNRVPKKNSGKKFGQACGKFCFSEESVCQFSENICAVEIRNLTGPPDKDWLQLNFDDSHEFTRNLVDFHEKFGPFWTRSERINSSRYFLDREIWALKTNRSAVYSTCSVGGS